ncbi:copper transporter 6-like [Trifolium pratense]|uniref:copper transporter 6-like n=1 Tax=Trifolium pratense TaxID=57577 RepID=UPI001E6979D6|nr:copper transporter 6-like [Trifolium pratense]
MDDGHMHHGGMDGMTMTPPTPPPSSSSSSSNGGMGHEMHAMMHMTFFWGKDVLILFDNWPNGDIGKYVLALIIVFVMSVLIELLSRIRFIKPASNAVASGLVQTVLHVVRVGLAYLVMLALMSFNGGVFLVAVLGHAIGFFLCSSAFKKQPHHDEPYDLPPISC